MAGVSKRLPLNFTAVICYLKQGEVLDDRPDNRKKAGCRSSHNEVGMA